MKQIGKLRKAVERRIVRVNTSPSVCVFLMFLEGSMFECESLSVCVCMNH